MLATRRPSVRPEGRAQAPQRRRGREAQRSAWHSGAGGRSSASGRARIATYVASFFQDWWKLTLYAPQYPHGLRLTISLTGMGGDVHEIDMLNHYIGMGHLAEAAQFERHYAAWGVASSRCSCSR